jgi:hypothetical protein
MLLRTLFTRIHRPINGNASTPSQPSPHLAAGHVPPLLIEHITP